ncbi:MAG: alpha/beta hydrolase [Planctomycetales bacterium]|nr:alpha/beta hydrolase [Planctomycetales bacterium]
MKHRTQMAETDRGPVEYSDAGDGEPILYFHGTGGTGNGMMPFEYPLVNDGFRLIMPNRPGYGKTPLAQNRGTRDCATVVAALLDTLGIERAAVMGSSGGGTFALSFALTHPARCRSLTLLCPQLHRWTAGKWMPHSGRWLRPFLNVSVLRKLLMAGYRAQFSKLTTAQFLEMEAGTRYASVKDDRHALEVAEASLDMMKKGVKFPGFENDMRIFVREDVFAEWDILRPPTMVIHDPVDPMAPVSQIDWFCSRVPSCRRFNVETAGHLVWAGRDFELVHETRVQFLRESLEAADSN